MLTIGMDANYRLRSKLRGIITDPHLSPGWSYFVDHVPYAKFVANYIDQAEVSSSLLLCILHLIHHI